MRKSVQSIKVLQDKISAIYQGSTGENQCNISMFYMRKSVHYIEGLQEESGAILSSSYKRKSGQCT